MKWLVDLYKGEIMKNNLEAKKILRDEIEEKRNELYELLELELNDEKVVDFSQELDLLINKYNELSRK